MNYRQFDHFEKIPMVYVGKKKKTNTNVSKTPVDDYRYESCDKKPLFLKDFFKVKTEEKKNKQLIYND